MRCHCAVFVNARQSSVLRRDDDPRAQKKTLPTILEAFERCLDERPFLSPQTASWYRQKVDGPLSVFRKLPDNRIDRAAVWSFHE